MAYDARAIANYFLDKADAEGRCLDPMGIQKLVYFAHGWNLAIRGTPLISQPIEAWDYGPVIGDLYQSFKEFGNRAITKRATRPRIDQDTATVSFVRPVVPDSDRETRAVLDRVWDLYKNYSSIQLSNLTHEADSPWTLAINAHETKVSNSTIKTYFESQAAHTRAARHGSAAG